MRTLLVVSGGDAPGINTFISRYCTLAHANGDDVYGADGGFAGLLDGHIHPISRGIARRLDGQGGTLLASSRVPVLSQDNAQARLREQLTQLNIDNIVLFGGNGTLRHIPPLLRVWNIPFMGIPTTIDNDIPGTARTLGFDTACNYAYQAIDGIIATAHALPGRIFMVETLGGDTGYIALAVADGAGAHAVLLPEYEFSLEWFGERLKDAIAREQHALVVLSEGVKAIPQFEEAIPRLTGVRLRYTKLGHAQRGGHVSHIDRVLAGDFARTAYTALRAGARHGIVIVRDGTVILSEDGSTASPLSLPDRATYARINGLAE